METLFFSFSLLRIGDYFGILMDSRVTSFPFNTMNNPMYNGSTIVFFALALWYGPLVLLSLEDLLPQCYRISLSGAL